MQPFEPGRARRRNPARMVCHDHRPDRIAQLEHRPAHRLVQLQMLVVHEVDREHAVHGVAQGPARADLLEAPPPLRQNPAADHQVQFVQRQLAVAGAGRLDPGELAVKVGQIGLGPVRAEAEPRDRVSNFCHGSSFPATKRFCASHLVPTTAEKRRRDRLVVASARRREAIQELRAGLDRHDRFAVLAMTDSIQELRAGLDRHDRFAVSQ